MKRILKFLSSKEVTVSAVIVNLFILSFSIILGSAILALLSVVNIALCCTGYYINKED